MVPWFSLLRSPEVMTGVCYGLHFIADSNLRHSGRLCNWLQTRDRKFFGSFCIFQDLCLNVCSSVTVSPQQDTAPDSWWMSVHFTFTRNTAFTAWCLCKLGKQSSMRGYCKEQGPNTDSPRFNQPNQDHMKINTVATKGQHRPHDEQQWSNQM